MSRSVRSVSQKKRRASAGQDALLRPRHGDVSRAGTWRPPDRPARCRGALARLHESSILEHGAIAPKGDGTRRPQACGCDVECALARRRQGVERAVRPAVRSPVDHRSRRLSRATLLSGTGACWEGRFIRPHSPDDEKDEPIRTLRLVPQRVKFVSAPVTETIPGVGQVATRKCLAPHRFGHLADVWR